MIELMNVIIFSTEDDNRTFKVLFNGTKKRFTDLLTLYMTDETIFRPLKFRLFIEDQGHKLIYEV